MGKNKQEKPMTFPPYESMYSAHDPGNIIEGRAPRTYLIPTDGGSALIRCTFPVPCGHCWYCKQWEALR